MSPILVSVAQSDLYDNVFPWNILIQAMVEAERLRKSSELECGSSG
jgi:hypothetical protein